MNGIKNLLKLLSSKGIVVKEGDEYVYKSESFDVSNPETDE